MFVPVNTYHFRRLQFQLILQHTVWKFRLNFAGTVIIDLQSLNSCHRIKLRWQGAKFSDIFIIFIFQITNGSIQTVGNRFPARWLHGATITWRCVHVGRKARAKKCACARFCIDFSFATLFCVQSVHSLCREPGTQQQCDGTNGRRFVKIVSV